MEKKLNNLIDFADFKSSWKAEQAKKTKRTETGLDILKEGLEPEEDRIEEIIPEGLPDDNIEEIDIQEDIEHIIDELGDLDDHIIDEVVNYLREILLELEQKGEIDEDFTDGLDNQYTDDWAGWIEEVIQMPEISEEGIKGVSDIIFGGSIEDRVEDDDDVECPDCEGTGQDDEGEECGRCDGEGRVYRPADIPPDDYSPEYEDDDEDEDNEDDDIDPAGGHGLHI